MPTTIEARGDSPYPFSFRGADSAGTRLRNRELKRPGVLPLEDLLPDIEASWRRSNLGCERRYHHRYEFFQTVQLVPLDEPAERPAGSALEVETHDISASGIGFTHTVPLPYKKVALTLVLPGGIEVTVTTKLLWCRFRRDGYYESGGQFLRCVHR